MEYCGDLLAGTGDGWGAQAGPREWLVIDCNAVLYGTELTAEEAFDLAQGLRARGNPWDPRPMRYN